MAGTKNHDYHILPTDPWPFIGSMSALTMTSGGVLAMHSMAGGKFVFMDKDDKPLQIANQDFEDLKKHPGVLVNLTGELKGDTITVTKVELAPAK